ncbi:MAG: class D sortase [Christensenellales bacterium]|jgi:sortase A
MDNCNVEQAKSLSKKNVIIGILVVLMLIGGFVMVMWEPATRMRQDAAMQKLTESIVTGDGRMMVNPKTLVVEGEDEEYPIDDMEEGIESINVANMPSIYTVNGIGLLHIPKIDLEMPIVEGASRVDLRYGAGHYTPSAALGQQGNSIVLGHRMYTHGRYFNRLDELAKDDEITVYDLNGSAYKYTVTETQIIVPSALMDYIDMPYNGSRLTLVTCTPVRKATHRLLVMAEMTE